MSTGSSPTVGSDDSRTGDAVRHPEMSTSAAASLRLAVLQAMVGQLTQELDPDVILQQALPAMRRIDRWQRIQLSLRTSDGLHWQPRAEEGMTPSEVGTLYPLGAGVVGRAYRTGQIQVVPDVHADPDCFLGDGVGPVGSELVIPIVFDGQVLGAINLESAQPAAFDEEDVALALSVAQILAIALANARRFAALQAGGSVVDGIAEGKLAIRDTAQQNEDALTAARAAYWELDVASQLFTFNERFYALHGITDAAGYQIPVETFVRRYVHPDSVPQLFDTLRWASQVGNTALHLAVEGQVLRTNGEAFWVSTNIWYERDATGAIVKLRGVNQDITIRKQAEALLRRREAEYRYLFDHHPYPMWVYDLQTLKFLAVNDAAVAKYGYTHDEFLRMTIADIRPPEELERLQEDLAQPRPDLQHSGPWRHRLKDGALIDVEIASHLIQLFGRAASLVVAQDVTAQKQVELALRMSEARFATIFEHSPIAIAISRLCDNRIVLVNAAFLSLTGHTREAVLGRTTLELNMWARPDDRREVLKQLHTGWHVRDIEVPLRQQDGCERTVLLAGDVVELNGETCALIQLTDITDLKTAQQELLALNHTLEERVAERTAEVQDLYEHAPAGYHSLDAGGVLIHINQTELDWLGYTREELIGRPFTDLITQESRAIFQANFPTFKQRGWVRDLEFELIRKDGTTFPGLISATAIYDPAGQYVMSRSTVMDVTERKATEAALHQANADLAQAARAKDEFLANMSHELRTPLNAILGYSEILLDMVYGALNPYQLNALRQVATSGEHLLALITDILDLAKVEAGRLDVQLEAVQIAEVCQASLLFVKEQALKKGLQVDVRMHNHLATIEVDPKRLKQMLVNLLSNAVKFTPAGGWVQLAVVVDAAAGAVRFAVEDNGIGIAPEELPRLFQPFVQLDSSLSRQHEGTGLGLALVRRLAELHGGSVTVESEVGVGSRFTIALPYRPVHLEDRPRADGQLAQGQSPAGEATAVALDAGREQLATRILLAEDNAESAQVVCDYLCAGGYAVTVVHNGQEAVGQAQALQPALILMDIQMPGLNGLEAIQRIRAAGLRDTPIIALTALAMPGDRERCLAAGADEYLTKPISLSTLAALLTTWTKPAAPEGAA
jgi:PAS domain S-box-containing protein